LLGELGEECVELGDLGIEALTALARVLRSTRIDSTMPSRALGSAVAWPDRTLRAAASASRVSFCRGDGRRPSRRA
jgi:hypothetical protein